MIGRDDLDRIRPLLTSGPLLGAELDLEYRVLALTVEPTEGRDLLDEGPVVPDARLQVLLHPVAEIAASFRERTDEGTRVMTFGPDQLVDLVAVLGEPTLRSDPFPGGRPSREGWGPRPSMSGGSNAPDGRAHHLHLDVDQPPYAFALHATFDDVEVRDPGGGQLWASDAAPHVPGGPMGPSTPGRQLPMA